MKNSSDDSTNRRSCSMTLMMILSSRNSTVYPCTLLYLVFMIYSHQIIYSTLDLRGFNIILPTCVQNMYRVGRILRFVTFQVEMQIPTDPNLPAEPPVVFQHHLGGDEAGDTLGSGKSGRISTQPECNPSTRLNRGAVCLLLDMHCFNRSEIGIGLRL